MKKSNRKKRLKKIGILAILGVAITLVSMYMERKRHAEIAAKY